MSIPVILWIQLSNGADSAHLLMRLSEQCKLHTFNNIDDILEKITEYKPHIICFDFDYPSFDGLTTLRNIKQQFPSIPILMLVEHNSEALVVWALRTRVWDYFTKPVNAEELLSRIKILSQFSNSKKSSHRQIALPESSIPKQFRVCTRATKHSTLPAIAYVENHFHEKVSLNIIAEHCGMKATIFSHAFKKETGSTFREFLLRHRIRKAAELLKHTNACVLEIACAVGFNDPSQFTRMFKRYINTTPTAFRAEDRQLPSQLFPTDEK